MNNLWYDAKSKTRNPTKKDIFHPQLIAVAIQLGKRLNSNVKNPW